jgi:hypothetical protein
MSSRKTTERLEQMLVQEGFQAYPAQPNKYWNADGRIEWTEGNLYQSSTASTWSRYDSDKDNEYKVDL